MNAHERKYNLIRRLESLGFTYAEAHQLRRIEMTLSRWSEAECNGEIERDETTEKPYRNSQAWIDGRSDKNHKWPVPDRERGALKRLEAIIFARNMRAGHTGDVRPYHQGDPRGCALYIVPSKELEQDGKVLPIDQYYTRGLAVCA